jgi:hypothetical protein
MSLDEAWQLIVHWIGNWLEQNHEARKFIPKPVPDSNIVYSWIIDWSSRPFVLYMQRWLSSFQQRGRAGAGAGVAAADVAIDVASGVALVPAPGVAVRTDVP